MQIDIPANRFAYWALIGCQIWKLKIAGNTITEFPTSTNTVLSFLTAFHQLHARQQQLQHLRQLALHPTSAQQWRLFLWPAANVLDEGWLPKASPAAAAPSPSSPGAAALCRRPSAATGIWPCRLSGCICRCPPDVQLQQSCESDALCARLRSRLLVLVSGKSDSPTD